MMYRRRPMMQRRYMYMNPEPSPMMSPISNQGELALKGIEKIPLPNEAEDDPVPSRNTARSFLPSFLNKIELDDIILIGLVFVLWQEGIEDELLLVLLIYILLT